MSSLSESKNLITRKKAPRTRQKSKKFCPPKLTSQNLLLILSVLVICYTLLVLFGEVLFLLPFHKSEWCESYDPKYEFSEYGYVLEGVGSGDGSFPIETNTTGKEYENPDYITDPCRYERIPQLCWLTIEECDMSRRMLASVFLGGAIGYERRASDRPAGIRTMGLVSLGSCFFAISSQLAFKSSTMGWDSSRVTAAIPSGVGFLGAGLIFKGTTGVGENEVHQVHGLTTAASLWLSAAVGVGCGGALYFPTVYGTILVLMVLRYGPKLYLLEDSNFIGEEEEDEEEDDFSNTEDDYSDANIENSSTNDYLSTNGKFRTENKSSSKESKESVKLLATESNQTRSKFGEGLQQSYDSLKTSEIHNKEPTSETNITDKIVLGSGNIVTPRFKDDYSSEAVAPVQAEDELQRSLHVAFDTSVDNIEDTEVSKTPLKYAPQAEKKKKRHSSIKHKIPSFHS